MIRSVAQLLAFVVLPACQDVDAGRGPVDVAAPDSGSTDSGSTDGGSTDSGSTDSGSTDGGATDSGSTSEEPCEDGRAGVLVYGPTDFQDSGLLEAAGYEVTVWDEAAWRAARTEDFARFSLIVVGEQSCNGPDGDGELQALVDTMDTWGPALDGRVAASGFDLVCHIVDFEHTKGGDAAVPPLLYENLMGWLDDGCGTAGAFATDWGRREGAYLPPFGEWEEVSLRGNAAVLREPGHPVLSGVDPGGLDNWGASYHTAFSVVPATFTVLVDDFYGWGAVLAVSDPEAR